MGCAPTFQGRHQIQLARAISLAIEFAGDKPPTEFRIFKAGVNSTRKGKFIFDASSAELVMAAYEEHATDVMFDLEHLSLDTESKNFDPDARGWCALEVRNGELWAVNVKWTTDGHERLVSKRQRFFSPVIRFDEEGRITGLFNIAITALPATDGLMPLMAASNRTRSPAMGKLSLALAMAACASIAASVKAGAPTDQIVKLAEGEAAAAGYTMAELATFLGVAIDPGADPAGFIKAICAELRKILTGLEGGAEPASEPAADAEMVATTRAIFKLCNAVDATDAIVKIADWRKLAIEHEDRVKKLRADEKALEQTKRRALTARLVCCRAETPGTAWADDEKTMPAKHLASMSLEDLEKRAKDFEALSGARAPLVPLTTTTGLTERDKALAKDSGVDEAKFAAVKARVDARRAAARAAREEG